MPVSTLNPSYTSFSSVLFEEAAKKEKEDKSFSALLNEPTPEEMIHEMVKDGVQGYMKWEVKKMEEKVRAEVMAAMGVTQESLNKMDVNARAELEKRISEEVARRLKDLMEKKMQEDAIKRGEGAVPLVDTATSGGIFSLLTTSM